MELGAGRRYARVAGRTARSRRWASVRAGRARRAWRAGRAGVRRAAGARALAGARVRGRAAAGHRRRRAGRERQAGRGALGVGARGARPGHDLGGWAGLGQCTWCTRPIFDPF